MTSNYRSQISEAVDRIENDVASILHILDEVEKEASVDVEDLNKKEIDKMQVAIIEAIKGLKKLGDDLW